MALGIVRIPLDEGVQRHAMKGCKDHFRFEIDTLKPIGQGAGNLVDIGVVIVVRCGNSQSWLFPHRGQDAEDLVAGRRAGGG